MCVEMQDLIYRSLIEVVQAGRNRVSESLVVCVGMYSTTTYCMLCYHNLHTVQY
jgi:hypothetical protein